MHEQSCQPSDAPSGLGLRLRDLCSLCCLVLVMPIAACGPRCNLTAGISLASQLMPRDTTVAVGQSFILWVDTPKASCDAPGSDSSAAPHDLRATNSTVVTVDTLTGRVTAIATGDATVASVSFQSLSSIIHVR